MRIFPATVAALVVTAIAFGQDELLERARRLQLQAPGVDTHIDTVQRVLIDKQDLGVRSAKGHADLPRLREGGVTVPMFSLWVPTWYPDAEAVRRTLQLRDAMQTVFDKYPEQIELATSISEIDRITRAGKIAALLSAEGGHQIDDDLAVLRMYYKLGIRSMTLSHFRNNHWADSSTDTPVHNGLTEFGKQVVREMNRLGMLVDVSHVSDKAFYDALAATSKPVIASHSSCRAISDVRRNMTDDMLRALGRNGGVVGINFAEGFINFKDNAALAKSIARISGGKPPASGGKALDDYAVKDHESEKPYTPIATIEDVVAHIDHAVKIAGIDHVGIGSDYDGITGPPRGLEDISKMTALTAALLKHGYREQDVQKIRGGNFLRVMRQVLLP
jgi:membrane dipeptidase